MWQRFQHYLSLTADLIQIGGFFGLTPAALITLACAAIGWISQIPTFNLVVGLILVFAASLYLTRELIIRIGAIPLTEAARIAYEQLRGTLWGTAAERSRADSSPDGILDYMGTGLSLKIPIFGKFPPSTILERVPTNQLGSGSIEGGAKFLQLRDKHRTRITDLIVRKSSLRKAIREMKDSTKDFTN